MDFLFRNESDKDFFCKIMKINSEEEIQALRNKYANDNEFQKFVDRVIDDEIRRLRFIEYGPVEKFYDDMDPYYYSYAYKQYGTDSDRLDEYYILLGERIDRRCFQKAMEE